MGLDALASDDADLAGGIADASAFDYRPVLFGDSW